MFLCTVSTVWSDVGSKCGVKGALVVGDPQSKRCRKFYDNKELYINLPIFIMMWTV